MRKNVMMVVAAFAAALMTGCVATHMPPIDRRVTVSPDLGMAVWVTDVRLTKAQSQHYTLQANVVNNTEGVLRVEYKVVWLDASGRRHRLPGGDDRRQFRAARDVVGLTATAPAPEAVDFRFYVQPARSGSY